AWLLPGRAGRHSGPARYADRGDRPRRTTFRRPAGLVQTAGMARVVVHHRRTDSVYRLRAVGRLASGHVCLRLRLPTGRPHVLLERLCHPRRERDLIRHIAVRVSAEGSVSADPLGGLVIETALQDLWYGFGVAFEPHNLLWCFVGVLVGNMVGVLPGMGPLATISILLPLTSGLQPVPASLMLPGFCYGPKYGGAIFSFLLTLPCHPPHAVTCLDGFPLTKQGKGGTALGITVIASFVGASFGITEMIFLAPLLVQVALQFGPAEVCTLMLLGLLAGSTLARGSPVKGVAMTVLGLLLSTVGSDLAT